MRRQIYILLLTVAVLALTTWAVDTYVRPILPATLARQAVFFLGVTVAIVGILSSMKDALELTKSLFSRGNSKQESADKASREVVNGESTSDAQKKISGPGGPNDYLIPSFPLVDFIGRQDDLKRLLNAVRNPQIPLITLKGMGGIGKTALAQEAIRKVVDENYFDWIAWTSTQAESFVGEGVVFKEVADYSFDALLADILRQAGLASNAGAPTADKIKIVRNRLATTRALIVLDNLETVPDRDVLIGSIFEILGRGKVLITSRYAITHNRNFTIELGGLSIVDGIAFLKKTASRQNNQNLMNASKDTLSRIHDVTGGAPLAMMLVSGQMYYQPVDRVIRGIEEAGVNNLSYEFYSFIFKRSWSDLNSQARKVLIAMRHFEGSPTAEAVRYTVDMSEDNFYSAATMLVQRSLLSVALDTREARYSLHPLTRYFINTDIAADWN